MDDAHARTLLRSWPICCDQAGVYYRVLNCLRDCDLPSDLKPMLRSIAVQRWAMEVGTMETLPKQQHGT